MIKLIVPNEEYLPSYKEAYDEYVDKGISTYSFTDASSCDVFAKFDRYRNERNLPPDRVDADIFWLWTMKERILLGRSPFAID